MQALSNVASWVLVLISLVVFLPIITYVSTRMGFMAYYRTRQEFKKKGQSDEVEAEAKAGTSQG